MELGDFRQLVGVYEGEEEFIEKRLRGLLSVAVPAGHWLAPLVAAQVGRVEVAMVGRAKREKVERFLNGTHRYIL